MSVLANLPRWIRETPEHLKTQEICNEAVGMEPYSWEYVPDRFKIEGMCKKAVHRKPYTLPYVPGHLIMQEMCEEIMCENLAVFFLIPDCFKIKKNV